MPSSKSRPVFGCTQCQMLSINGVACHETGCPNAGAKWNPGTGEWEHWTECRECGAEVMKGDVCACLDESDDWRDDDSERDAEDGCTCHGMGGRACCPFHGEPS